MNRIPFALAAVIFGITCISCAGNRRFEKDRALFQSSSVTAKYKSISDMNDAFFVLKENNLAPPATLFIDDSTQNIEAAKALGLQTVLLKEGMQIEDLGL